VTWNGIDKMTRSAPCTLQMSSMLPRTVLVIGQRPAKSCLDGPLVRGPKRYSAVKTPVTLIYGDKDWSRVSERDRTKTALPNSRLFTLPATVTSPAEIPVCGGGHSLWQSSMNG
jgi:hypothetical protein